MRLRRTSTGILLPTSEVGAVEMVEVVGIKPVLRASDLAGRTITADALIRDVSLYDWRAVVDQAAQWASLLMNADEENEAYYVELDAARRGPPAIAIAVEEALEGGRRAIVHPRALYFLQSLAVLHGNESGRAPTFFDILRWSLIANQHIPGWDEPGSSRADAVMATYWRAYRDQARQDSLRHLVRSAVLLRDPPPRGPLSEPAKWEQMKRAAFNGPFSNYVEGFAGLVASFSVLWGKKDDSGRRRNAIIRPSQLPDSGRFFLEELTWTRAEIGAQLRVGLVNGLPGRVGPLYRRPFVRFGEDHVCAWSPGPVRDALSLGSWARMLRAVKAEYGDPTPWFSAFGDLFERWCRHCAREAQAELFSTGTERPHFHFPSAGDEGGEMGDLVIFEEGRAMIFEMKSRVAEELIAKAEAGVRDAKIVKWLHEVFLKKADGSSKPRSESHRGGAIRQLDSIAKAVLGGRHAAIVGRPTLITPVVVTYERVHDNPGLYLWLEEQCKNEGLLQTPGIQPITVCSVVEFEILLSLVAKGKDVFDLLGRWRRETRLLPFDWLIKKELDATLEESRLRFFDDEAKAIFGRMESLLWNAQVEERSGAMPVDKPIKGDTPP